MRGCNSQLSEPNHAVSPVVGCSDIVGHWIPVFIVNNGVPCTVIDCGKRRLYRGLATVDILRWRIRHWNLSDGRIWSDAVAASDCHHKSKNSNHASSVEIHICSRKCSKTQHGTSCH